MTASLRLHGSLTKLWSLAGIRAGYLLAPPETVELLAAQRQPWPVNSVACAALEWCGGDTVTPAAVAAEVSEARDELVRGLAELGIETWPSAAHVLLLRAPSRRNVVALLSERGIAVRSAASFPGFDGTYVRVAVRQRADNRRLLHALREVLA